MVETEIAKKGVLHRSKYLRVRVGVYRRVGVRAEWALMVRRCAKEGIASPGCDSPYAVRFLDEIVR